MIAKDFYILNASLESRSRPASFLGTDIRRNTGRVPTELSTEERSSSDRDYPPHLAKARRKNSTPQWWIGNRMKTQGNFGHALLYDTLLEE